MTDKAKLLEEILAGLPEDTAKMIREVLRGERSFTIELTNAEKGLSYSEKDTVPKRVFEQSASESILESSRPGSKSLGPKRGSGALDSFDGSLVRIAVERHKADIVPNAMYSPREAAYTLGVNVKTILRWIQAGGIKSTKFGTRQHRIRGTDLLGMK